MPQLRSQPLERLRDATGKTPPHNPSSPETLAVVVMSGRTPAVASTVELPARPS